MKLTTADRAEQLRAAWRARGWPEELLERAQAMQVRASRLKRWAADDRWAPAKTRDALGRQARLPLGSVRVRTATWEDNDALVALYADSPSNEGGWEVTVERGPFAFAQFALQDQSEVQVVEDGGELLAALAHANTTMLAGGVETAVYIPLGWRVRKHCRGEGLGPLLQKSAHKRFAGPNVNMLYYRRRASKKAQRADVFCYPARASGATQSRVRLAQRSDLAACVELINSVQQRHDVFRRYEAAYLTARLDGVGRESRAPVYSWQDYYVVEEGGRIVACGGRGPRVRHMRERWRHKTTREERTVANTALIDFGYAEGRDDAMAMLTERFIGISAELGRAHFMAPLQFLPELAALLERYQPEQETRAFYWHNNATLRGLGFMPTKPYTDLAYW